MPWARLRRFFDERGAVRMEEAVALLGCTPRWLADELDLFAVPPPNRKLPWNKIAAVVCDVLTPVDLDAAAGTLATFPALLRVAPVEWRLPAYLIIAMEHLVAEEKAVSPFRSRLTVEAYAARRLDLMLDPDIFQRLSIERAFREAFHFPEEVE